MSANEFQGLIEANIRPKDAQHNFIIRVVTTGGIFEGILTEVDDDSITLNNPVFSGLPNEKKFENLILDKSKIIGWCYATGMKD